MKAVPDTVLETPLKVTIPVVPLNKPPLFTQLPYTSRLYPFAIVIKPERFIFRHLALLDPIVGEKSN